MFDFDYTYKPNNRCGYDMKSIFPTHRKFEINWLLLS